MVNREKAECELIARVPLESIFSAQDKRWKHVSSMRLVA